MKVVKRFTFDSAHYLPNYNGKCKQMHGHTYMLDVIIDGKINQDTGMIVDFHDIDFIVNRKVLSDIDHHCLNDIIENPTAENVVIYILEKLKKEFRDFKITLRLWESQSSYVEV